MNGVYIAVYLSLTLAFSNFRSKDALLTKPDQDNTNATLEGKLSKETDVDTRVSLYPNPSVCPLKCVCQVKSMYCYYTIPDVIPSSAEDVTLMAKSWAEFKDQKRFCHKTWSTVKTLELVFAFSSAFGHNILVNEIDCLEQLQTLKLNNMYANLRFSNSAFSDLQNLKTLDLSVSDVDISSLTDTLAVPKILPNLTTLILKGLERYFRPLQLNQSFIESFSNRQLQHIDLSEQKLEFYFYNISMLCNRLKTLNLSYSIIDVTRMKPENCHSLELIDISGSNLLERSFEDHKHGGRYYKRCINKFVPLAEGLGFHLPRRVIASSMFRAPHEFGVRYDYEIINCTVYLDLCCTEELVYKYNSYSPNNFHFVFASQCLKFIDLSENTIDIINADAIKFLTNLENVDLSNNEFGYESNFHAVPLSETNLGTVFYYNKNLLVVNLAGNHLPTLPGDTFASNPKLTNINLSHNSFSQIHFKISHLIHLEKLDLRHNNIRFLDSNSRNELDELYRRQIETRRTLNESKTLQILLDGNPFLCECYLYEFCLWFEAAPFLETTKHNSYCVVNEKMDSHAVDAAEEDCQRHMFTPTYFQYLYIKCSIFVERNALKLSIGAGILILTSLGICARSYYIKTLNQRFFKTKPLRKGSESKRDSPGSALGAPENGEESSRPGSFLQLEDRRSLVTDYQHILDASESVGKLSGFGYTGTCFRVGENYIMTAWHVINDIVREGLKVLGHGIGFDPFAVLANTDHVYIDFGFLSNASKTQKINLSSNVVFKNESLDIAIVELQSTGGQSIPVPLTLSPNTLLEDLFTFVGHPGGEFKQLNPIDGFVTLTNDQKKKAVEFSHRVAGANGFGGIDNQGRILFHCSFQKGGSGSPGLVVVGTKAVVITVLLHGYPDWFYDPKVDKRIKDTVHNHNKIEQGVLMESLYKALHAGVHRDVFDDIFRGNVGTPMDEG